MGAKEKAKTIGDYFSEVASNFMDVPENVSNVYDEYGAVAFLFPAMTLGAISCIIYGGYQKGKLIGKRKGMRQAKDHYHKKHSHDHKGLNKKGAGNYLQRIAPERMPGLDTTESELEESLGSSHSEVLNNYESIIDKLREENAAAVKKYDDFAERLGKNYEDDLKRETRIYETKIENLEKTVAELGVANELVALETDIKEYMNELYNYFLSEHDEVDRDRDEFIKKHHDEDIAPRYHLAKAMRDPYSSYHQAVKSLEETARTLFPRAQDNVPQTPQKLLEIINKAQLIHKNNGQQK